MDEMYPEEVFLLGTELRKKIRKMMLNYTGNLSRTYIVICELQIYIKDLQTTNPRNLSQEKLDTMINSLTILITEEVERYAKYIENFPSKEKYWREFDFSQYRKNLRSWMIECFPYDLYLYDKRLENNEANLRIRKFIGRADAYILQMKTKKLSSDVTCEIDWILDTELIGWFNVLGYAVHPSKVRSINRQNI